MNATSQPPAAPTAFRRETPLSKPARLGLMAGCAAVIILCYAFSLATMVALLVVLAIEACLALALARFFRALLYGISPADPFTLTAVILLLLATFAAVFSVSTFVVGPALTGTDDPPAPALQAPAGGGRDGASHRAHHP